MENIKSNNNIEKKFQTPEEEIAYLKDQIRQREQQIEKVGEQPDREKVIEHTITDYKKNTPEDVLEKGNVIPEKIREEIVLQLSPEEHDGKMSELISMVEKKGVLNALDVVEKTNDPHLNDDFHRFLVQYLRQGYTVKGLDEKSKIAKNLNRVLFEVTVPGRGQGDEEDLQKLISKMEQFYTGMLDVTSADPSDYITLEITNAIGSRQFIFYVSTSLSKKELFEKQLLAFFPNAKILEQKDDFNVFNSTGVSLGSYVSLKNTAAKPIKTYDQFQNDPLKAVLNVFSKLDATKEAAAIQLIFNPTGGFYEKNYAKSLSRLEKGEKPGDELYLRNTKGDKFVNTVSNLFSGFGGGEDVKKEDEQKEIQIDSNLVEQVRNKLSKPIVSTNIRIITSGEDEARASSILSDIKSAFNQFQDPLSNEFVFVDEKPKFLKNFFKNFTYREYSQSIEIPLNLAEISTILHLPGDNDSSYTQLKSKGFSTSAAPIDLATSGVLLGINEHQGSESEVYLSEQDRMRHFYTIGQTGTGKTNFLKTMIIQDIKNGEGVCMIDPHGSDIQDVLANIPPERQDDVIYFDPANTERPMALNMLEYNPNYPEQKTFVVNELFNIFMKLYGSNPESMGPMFEQYFRNATMLVIEDPDTGSTLLDVSRVLADPKYRQLKLSRCKNPVVKQFWEEVAAKAGGEASLANIVPYITSKFDVFLANDIMRPIIAQEKSSFNFREVMDNKKILLVNLSKGRLGDINSNLIGLIIVGKILMASLSRVDSMDKELAPFYLYIDEFQNITTDSIATILSEARKYKLSLNIAHQFIAQLDEKISDAVFGNVGSMAIFRVGSEDATFFEKQLEPTFSAQDIMNIDNFNFYAKILANGVPVKPFSVKALKAPDGDRQKIEELKNLSYQKYGRDRKEIENEIMERYKKESPQEEKGEENPFSKLNK